MPSKYLNNFWRTIVIPWINCEISTLLTWSKKCFLVTDTAANQEPTFTITYVSVVTLSTQNNVKLFKQLESGFKRKINWNKYQSKITEHAQNRCLDFSIDSSFKGVNRYFVLWLEDKNIRESYKLYFLPAVEIKDYNCYDLWKKFYWLISKK